MAGFSNHLENALIDATLRGSTYVGGAVYLALFTSNPNDDASGDELADSGYGRQQAHTSSVSDGFTAGSNGMSTNSKTISFPAIVDAQVTVTHWAIFDSQSGGNMLYHAELTNPKTLDPSDVLSLPINALSITLS